MERGLIPFRIDPDFKQLIPPLTPDEFRQLEQNLLAEGCREPLCVWNGILLDGHNRYEICTTHNIPFTVQNIQLESHDAAVAWICKNQLGRRNISEETRKYLIGKRYEAEKKATVTFPTDEEKKSEKTAGPNIWAPTKEKETFSKTAWRLGAEYHISHATVDKYRIYARAIDTLSEKGSDLVPKLLAGQVKMSHENVVELSSLPKDDVCTLSQKLSAGEDDYIHYAEARRELQDKSRAKHHHATSPIKNMPAFDPDAEVSSLTLTIPSWVSSITRTRKIADLQSASEPAKEKLRVQLRSLRQATKAMLRVLEEDKNHG